MGFVKLDLRGMFVEKREKEILRMGGERSREVCFFFLFFFSIFLFYFPSKSRIFFSFLTKRSRKR